MYILSTFDTLIYFKNKVSNNKLVINCKAFCIFLALITSFKIGISENNR